MLYFEIAFVVFSLGYLDVSNAFSQMAVRVPKGSDVRSVFHNELYAYLKPTGGVDRLAARLPVLKLQGNERSPPKSDKTPAELQ